MAPTAIVFSPHFAEHDTGDYHPEKIARVSWITEMLEERGLTEQLDWLEPYPAPTEAIERVHPRAYRSFVEERCLAGARSLDADTLVCEHSYSVALLAAGAAMRAVDAVMGGTHANAFSLARPPGHHARPAAAMGFCLFNNIAVAARHAQAKHGCGRVAIVDWDVHHGNGTQEIFYRDGTVWFGSLHESPLYPMTGDAEETGAGGGAGCTLNCPMPPHAKRGDYEAAIANQLAPALRAFRPDLLLISAGFDAHRRDPLASVDLETEDFAWLTDAVADLADELCGGRLVSVLEGGYDRLGLPESVAAHLERLIARAGA